MYKTNKDFQNYYESLGIYNIGALLALNLQSISKRKKLNNYLGERRNKDEIRHILFNLSDYLVIIYCYKNYCLLSENPLYIYQFNHKMKRQRQNLFKQSYFFFRFLQTVYKGFKDVYQHEKM